MDGAIPRARIIELFKNKSRQPKKKQKVAESEVAGEVIVVD